MESKDHLFQHLGIGNGRGVQIINNGQIDFIQIIGNILVYVIQEIFCLFFRIRSIGGVSVEGDHHIQPLCKGILNIGHKIGVAVGAIVQSIACTNNSKVYAIVLDNTPIQFAVAQDSVGIAGTCIVLYIDTVIKTYRHIGIILIAC